MRILIAESDVTIANSLSTLLRNASYTIDHTESGEEALEMLKHYDYDLFISELTLSDGEGYEVIRRLRRAQVSLPVMILSGVMRSQAKVRAFSIGADDFVVKPYDKDELLARIQALIRRARGFAEPRLRVGPLELNLESRMVNISGHSLHLTGKEYAILELLVIRKGAVLTKDTFLNHLYGGIDEPEMKIIDVFICKLRRKLQQYGAENLISTVWGRGYIMRDDEETSQHNPSLEDPKDNNITLEVK